ncbi:hypothetical protein DBV15_03294, partial [Temnothorax longispinosus]
VNIQHLLNKILFCRNCYILPYIQVISSNIVSSRQVVYECHYREIFHVYLSAFSLRLYSFLG